MRFNFAVYYIVLVFLFVTAFVQAAPVKVDCSPCSLNDNWELLIHLYFQVYRWH